VSNSRRRQGMLIAHNYCGVLVVKFIHAVYVWCELAFNRPHLLALMLDSWRHGQEKASVIGRSSACKNPNNRLLLRN